MSLIIYHERAIYADRAIAISNDSGDVRYSDGCKLFVSPCNQIAFAVCGDNPKHEDLPHYFKRLKYILRCLSALEKRKNKPSPPNEDKEAIKKYEDRNQELIGYIGTFAEEIRRNQDGKIFAISQEFAISMDLRKFTKKNDITSVLQGPSTSYGTGSTYWDLFCNNGLTPADCYAQVWKVEETVSKDFNMATMAEMLPLVLEKE